MNNHRYIFIYCINKEGEQLCQEQKKEQQEKVDAGW